MLLATAGESEVADDKLRAASEVLDTTSLYPAPLLALLTWAAGYYHHPIGEVLPLAYLRGAQRQTRAPAQRGWRGINREVAFALGRLIGHHNKPNWSHCLRGPLRLSEIAARGISRAVVKALIERELAAPCEVHAEQTGGCDQRRWGELRAANRDYHL